MYSDCYVLGMQSNFISSARVGVAPHFIHEKRGSGNWCNSPKGTSKKCQGQSQTWVQPVPRATFSHSPCSHTNKSNNYLIGLESSWKHKPMCFPGTHRMICFIVISKRLQVESLVRSGCSAPFCWLFS